MEPSGSQSPPADLSSGRPLLSPRTDSKTDQVTAAPLDILNSAPVKRKLETDHPPNVVERAGDQVGPKLSPPPRLLRLLAPNGRALRPRRRPDR